MKQYLPYYRHLRAVKWPFILGVFCGLIYAAASGAGNSRLAVRSSRSRTAATVLITKAGGTLVRTATACPFGNLSCGVPQMLRLCV